MMGTMKMGMPIYDETKSEVDQFPARKTENPATKTMIVDPMKPNQAANGWKGAFQGKVSRLTPCTFIALWKRM